MYIEWSLYLLQIKITGLHIVDLDYTQTQSFGKLLTIVYFRQESEMKWMLLNLSNQSIVACVGKRVTLDKDYTQTQSFDELLKVVQFRWEYVMKWMLLNLSNQSAMACVGKMVTLDEDAQPYNASSSNWTSEDN